MRTATRPDKSGLRQQCLLEQRTDSYRYVTGHFIELLSYQIESYRIIIWVELIDLISESYDDIEINESGLKNLHNILLKYSQNDEWHKGDYKQQCGL